MKKQLTMILVLIWLFYQPVFAVSMVTMGMMDCCPDSSQLQMHHSHESDNVTSNHSDCDLCVLGCQALPVLLNSSSLIIAPITARYADYQLFLPHPLLAIPFRPPIAV